MSCAIVYPRPRARPSWLILHLRANPAPSFRLQPFSFRILFPKERIRAETRTPRHGTWGAYIRPAYAPVRAVCAAPTSPFCGRLIGRSQSPSSTEHTHTLPLLGPYITYLSPPLFLFCQLSSHRTALAPSRQPLPPSLSLPLSPTRARTPPHGTTMFRIEIYRYRYRCTSSSPHPPPPPCPPALACSPISPPHAYTYLESPQNIHEGAPTRIIVRERGGPNDNNVQWVLATDVVPLSPFRAASTAHGMVVRANFANDRGDMVWLRSDQPLIAGRRTCPVVNLRLLRGAEVGVEDVRWRADWKVKRRGREEKLGCVGVAARQGKKRLTMAGPVFSWRGQELRSCVAHGAEGRLELVSTEELGRLYEEEVIRRGEGGVEGS